MKKVEKELDKLGFSNGTVKEIVCDFKTMQPVEWIWENLIPHRAVTLLSGKGGIGKSTLAIYLSARLSKGQLPGIVKGTPVKTVLIGGEDDPERVLWPRYNVNGGEEKLFSTYVYAPSEGVDTPIVTIEELKEVLADLEDKNCGLVIIDPVTGLLPPNGNINDARPVQKLMHTLGALADKHNLAILALAHTNKGGGHGDELTSGSSQWVNACRSVLLLGQHPEKEEEVILSIVKSNYATPRKNYSFIKETQTITQGEIEIEAPKITLIGETELHAEQCYNRAVKKYTPAKSKILATMLTELLEHHPEGLTKKQIEEHITNTDPDMKITDKTFRLSVQEANIQTRKTNGFPRETYYYLPNPQATPGSPKQNQGQPEGNLTPPAQKAVTIKKTPHHTDTPTGANRTTSTKTPGHNSNPPGCPNQKPGQPTTTSTNERKEQPPLITLNI